MSDWYVAAYLKIQKIEASQLLHSLCHFVILFIIIIILKLQPNSYRYY